MAKAGLRTLAPATPRNHQPRLGYAPVLLAALLSPSALAGIDYQVIDSATDWLETELSPVANSAEDMEYLLGLTSSAVALEGVSARAGLHDELKTALENIELKNNDVRARGLKASQFAGEDVLQALLDAYIEPDASHGGWGLSSAYRPSPLETALALQVVSEAGNELKISNATAWLAEAQQDDGSWLSNEGGTAGILATATVVRALSRFSAADASAQAAIDQAVPFLEAVPVNASVLQRAHAGLALYSVQGGSAKVRQLAESLVPDQSVDGSWGGDIFSTATVLELMYKLVGSHDDELSTVVTVATEDAREAINTALGKNDYDQITLADLRSLSDLDLSDVSYPGLGFLQGSGFTQSLTLPQSHQLTLEDIAILLSIPGLNTVWLGAQQIDMGIDGDQDGLPDDLELLVGTDPLEPDTDGDNLPDGWELEYGFDPGSLAGAEETFADSDGDGASNLVEYLENTSPVDGNSAPRTTNGLVAYYPMTSGPAMRPDHLRDVSGYGTPIDLALSGNASHITGSNGVRFVEGGYAQSTGSPHLGSTFRASDAFSVEVWVKSEVLWDESTTAPAIFSYSFSASTQGINLFQSSAQDVHGQVWTTLGAKFYGPANESVSSNLEHYILTFSNGTVRIFRNGSLAYSFAEAAGVGSAGSSSEESLALAFEATGLSGTAWSGEMYQVALYDRALAPSEIASHFLRGHQPLDADQDGLPNVTDVQPLVSDVYDSDGDGLADSNDNCIYTANSSQADFDSDGLGDACDEDSDNDGLTDDVELANGLDPFNQADADQDWDGDGLSNKDELLNGLNINSSSDADADPDVDGLTSRDEISTHGTDPLVADTDGDGMKDGDEVTWLYDPHDPADGLLDDDGDGLTNAEEVQRYGTSPKSADTDNDGVDDFVEKKIVPWLIPVISIF